MTASGAHFEIKMDGVVRSYRDIRETAVEAARFLQQRSPIAKIAVTDRRVSALNALTGIATASSVVAPPRHTMRTSAWVVAWRPLSSASTLLPRAAVR